MNIFINSNREYLDADILSFKQNQPDSILVIKNFVSDSQVELIRSFYAKIEFPPRNSYIVSDNTDSFFCEVGRTG